MSKNILVLTPVYPADDFSKETPPIVHYFTKEWIKLGHNVIVMNFPTKFPRVITGTAALFEQALASFFGFSINTSNIKPREYTLDDVVVKRVPIKKIVPHSRFSPKEIKRAISETISFCKAKQFVPDIIISHWANPGTEIMPELKKVFKAKTCFVEHSPGTDFLNMFSKEQALETIGKIDIIGFRSDYIKKQFCERYNYKRKSFMCYSGIPEVSVVDNKTERTFKSVSKFIYVGHMIKRKHPTALIPAISNAFENKDFIISFIGRGGEEKNIAKTARKFNVEGNIKQHGRLEREKVFCALREHDVFIMISENETFGLVYLEAMAAGCITIASKREGFDGIIKHGYNGFLCEAGNEEELAKLIKQIRSMASDKLQDISRNAVSTALELTDKNVAQTYIESILNS